MKYQKELRAEVWIKTLNLLRPFNNLFCLSFVVFDIHSFESQKVILVFISGPGNSLCFFVFLRMVWVLQKWTWHGVDESDCERFLPVFHGHQIAQKSLHSVRKLTINITKLVPSTQVFVNLLQQTFDCCILAAQSTIIKFKFQFRDCDFACFALKEISLEVAIRIDFECDLKSLFWDFSVIFSFNRVSSAVFAGKTHDDEIGKVWDACFAELHFSRHHASMTGDLKDDRLLVHEILFLKRLIKIELNTFLSFLSQFNLLLSFLLRKSHGHQLFDWPLKVVNLNVLIRKWVIEVLNVWVAAWVTNADCQWEKVSLKSIFSFFQQNLRSCFFVKLLTFNLGCLFFGFFLLIQLFNNSFDQSFYCGDLRLWCV